MDCGFQNKEMLLIQLVPGVFGMNRNQGQAYYTQLIEQVEAVPTVKQVSLASFVPFSLFGGGPQSRSMCRVIVRMFLSREASGVIM